MAQFFEENPFAMGLAIFAFYIACRLLNMYGTRRFAAWLKEKRMREAG